MKLTIYNDTRPYRDDGHVGELGVSDWPSAAHQLRQVFSDHRTITTLGSTEIIAAPGAEHMLQDVHERLGQFVADLGNSIEDCWVGARHAIQNMPAMEHEPKFDSLADIYPGTVLCVASGPSTQAWMPLLRRLQNDCIIVCADSIWNGLRANGIDPHFVCALERSTVIAGLINADPSSRSTLVLPATSYPGTAKGWEGRRVWWWQTYDDLYQWLSPNIQRAPTGRSAGTMAAALAIHLGAERICLIGHDLARSGLGSSHAADVHPITNAGHAKAAEEPESLHSPVLIDGLSSCRFWDLVRTDLQTLAQDYPGRLVRWGQEGLDIPTIPRVDTLKVIIQAEMKPFGPVTPSRSADDIAAQVSYDRKRFMTKYVPRILENLIKGTEQSIAEAHAMCLPKTWGNGSLEYLYRYVLGNVYRAASLRAHLRAGSADSHASAARVMLRGIPPTLAMMERDLCPASATTA